MAKQTVAMRNLRKRVDVLSGKLELQTELVRVQGCAWHRIAELLERVAVALESGRARCVRSRATKAAPAPGEFATELPKAETATA